MPSGPDPRCSGAKTLARLNGTVRPLSQADIQQAVARMENDPRFDPYSPEMRPKAESEKLRKHR